VKIYLLDLKFLNQFNHNSDVIDYTFCQFHNEFSANFACWPTWSCIQYLTDVCQPASSASGRRRLRSSTRGDRDLIVVSTSTKSDDDPLYCLLHRHGTSCHQISRTSVVGVIKSGLTTHLFVYMYLLSLASVMSWWLYCCGVCVTVTLRLCNDFAVMLRRVKMSDLLPLPTNSRRYTPCLCVCPCVCPCAGYLKKLFTYLNHILWNDTSSAKDQSIRFLDWSVSKPGYRVDISISSTWRDREF